VKTGAPKNLWPLISKTRNTGALAKKRQLNRAASIEREETKRILLRIADDYERIAKMVERQRDRDQT